MFFGFDPIHHGIPLDSRRHSTHPEFHGIQFGLLAWTEPGGIAFVLDGHDGKLQFAHIFSETLLIVRNFPSAQLLTDVELLRVSVIGNTKVPKHTLIDRSSMLEKRDVVVKVALIGRWGCAKPFSARATATTALVTISCVPLTLIWVRSRSR